MTDYSVSFGRPDQLVLDEFSSTGELFHKGLCHKHMSIYENDLVVLCYALKFILFIL